MSTAGRSTGCSERLNRFQLSVVIDDLDVRWPFRSPYKAHAPLTIDANGQWHTLGQQQAVAEPHRHPSPSAMGVVFP